MTWLAIIGLCALSFLFSGIEAGLLSLDPVRLRSRAKQGLPGARRLLRLQKRPTRLLVTVLLLTNIIDICALLIATRALVERFGHLGYFIAAAAAIPVYLFVLTVLPKALFRRLPVRTLAALGGILESASILLSPVLFVGELVGRLFLPRRKSERARLFAAREELKQVAVQGEREGALTAAERAMIHNVVDFRNVRMADVMVPLAKSMTVRPDTPPEEILRLSSSSGLNRFPVIAEDGRAVGLVNVFDILLDTAPPGPLARYLRRIVTATDDEPAYRIIRRLRAARLGLAAVVDARQQLVGIASSEDLIRRLVQSA